METLIDNPKPFLGRHVETQIDFIVDGTFQSMYASNKWLKDNGYGYGSTDAMNPTPVMKCDYYSYNLPHKWHNLTQEQKGSVHGIVTGDMRNGPVHVRIFKK